MSLWLILVATHSSDFLPDFFHASDCCWVDALLENEQYSAETAYFGFFVK